MNSRIFLCLLLAGTLFLCKLSAIVKVTQVDAVNQREAGTADFQNQTAANSVRQTFTQSATASNSQTSTKSHSNSKSPSKSSSRSNSKWTDKHEENNETQRPTLPPWLSGNSTDDWSQVIVGEYNYMIYELSSLIYSLFICTMCTWFTYLRHYHHKHKKAPAAISLDF
jgi:hypothetical protein